MDKLDVKAGIFSLVLVSFSMAVGYTAHDLMDHREGITVNSTVDFNPVIKNRTIVEERVTEKRVKSFIQEPYTEVNYSVGSTSFTVEDVDGYGVGYGYSMRPTIFDGNTILYKNYTGQDLDSGMIVSYDREGESVTHRIRGVYKGSVTVQGDNTDNWESISKSDIDLIALGVLFTDIERN